VFDEKLTEPMAKVLKNLRVKRAFVVHGMDGLDEITITGRSKVTELRNGRIRSYFVNPGSFGIKKAALKDIKGGSAKDNASIIKNILTGETGPGRDIVLMNSSVGLLAAGKAKNLKEGVRLAARSIDSAQALEKLEKLVRITKKGAK
jgi:anthranilate phosphoribosyltransferase